MGGQIDLFLQKIRLDYPLWLKYYNVPGNLCNTSLRTMILNTYGKSSRKYPQNQNAVFYSVQMFEDLLKIMPSHKPPVHKYNM